MRMQNPAYRWSLPTPSEPYLDTVSKKTRPRLTSTLTGAARIATLRA
jgi:hypothetical protein